MKKNLKSYRTSKKFKEGEICINLKRAPTTEVAVSKKPIIVIQRSIKPKQDTLSEKSPMETQKDIKIKEDLVSRKPVIKLPKRSLDNESLKSTDSIMCDKYKTFVRDHCSGLSIPFTPSINAMTEQFFNEILIKLEFINDQMMDVYAKAMLYCAVSKRTGITQKMFIGKTKKEIFKKAINEVETFKFIENESISAPTLTLSLIHI